ncbi:alpha/beta fold hydrolase [Phenylobacterium sp.]|uniref:alpha/beta fold hydrolase n=1 Tax=Phenylobacterium sp. TaxID=1871053 RepID=UPI0027311D43|nr:alpha/beta hydrolase [Phenylobacterium sp.]MDP1873495.1 alpha/beta hydrolase [Phenylobacterium sp.]MDP3490163.1 alpha/beta hydrolase [Phenylobacterium sp.]
MAAPVIMVHGAFCGDWTFEAFKAPFRAAGHTVFSPALRGHGASDADASVVGVSMLDYAADIAGLCQSQAEPPFLVGHSLGGLVCLLAARRAPVAGVVLLAPSPPWGVAGWSLEEGVTAFGLHLLGPFWSQAVTPDRNLMLRYSLDRLSPGARRPILERLRPESGRALWETLNWWLDPMMTTSLGGQTAAQALVMVGERDVVHPPATARLTAGRIGAELQILPEMSHWLPGEPGWQTVAERALAWIQAQAARPA